MSDILAYQIITMVVFSEYFYEKAGNRHLRQLYYNKKSNLRKINLRQRFLRQINLRQGFLRYVNLTQNNFKTNILRQMFLRQIELTQIDFKTNFLRLEFNLFLGGPKHHVRL